MITASGLFAVETCAVELEKDADQVTFSCSVSSDLKTCTGTTSALPSTVIGVGSVTVTCPTNGAAAPAAYEFYAAPELLSVSQQAALQNEPSFTATLTSSAAGWQNVAIFSPLTNGAAIRVKFDCGGGSAFVFSPKSFAGGTKLNVDVSPEAMAAAWTSSAVTCVISVSQNIGVTYTMASAPTSFTFYAPADPVTFLTPAILTGSGLMVSIVGAYFPVGTAVRYVDLSTAAAFTSADMACALTALSASSTLAVCLSPAATDPLAQGGPGATSPLVAVRYRFPAAKAGLYYDFSGNVMSFIPDALMTLSPQSGPQAGGTTITIAGTALADNVTFAGLTADVSFTLAADSFAAVVPGVSVANGVGLVLATPAFANGVTAGANPSAAVSIKVSFSAGAQYLSQVLNFVYDTIVTVTALSPTGTVRGTGSSITITGGARSWVQGSPAIVVRYEDPNLNVSEIVPCPTSGVISSSVLVCPTPGSGTSLLAGVNVVVSVAVVAPPGTFYAVPTNFALYAAPVLTSLSPSTAPALIPAAQSSNYFSVTLASPVPGAGQLLVRFRATYGLTAQTACSLKPATSTVLLCPAPNFFSLANFVAATRVWQVSVSLNSGVDFAGGVLPLTLTYAAAFANLTALSSTAVSAAWAFDATALAWGLSVVTANYTATPSASLSPRGTALPPTLQGSLPVSDRSMVLSGLTPGYVYSLSVRYMGSDALAVAEFLGSVTTPDLPPAITLASPLTGGAVAGGYRLTLTGEYLSTVTLVTVGGRTCPLDLTAGNNFTSLACIVPEGSGDSLKIVVTSPAGSTLAIPAFSYATPAVLSVSPSAITRFGSPGQTLTITGTNMQTSTELPRVTVAGLACTNITSVAKPPSSTAASNLNVTATATVAPADVVICVLPGVAFPSPLAPVQVRLGVSSSFGASSVTVDPSLLKQWISVSVAAQEKSSFGPPAVIFSVTLSAPPEVGQVLSLAAVSSTLPADPTRPAPPPLAITSANWAVTQQIAFYEDTARFATGTPLNVSLVETVWTGGTVVATGSVATSNSDKVVIQVGGLDGQPSYNRTASLAFTVSLAVTPVSAPVTITITSSDLSAGTPSPSSVTFPAGAPSTTSFTVTLSVPTSPAAAPAAPRGLVGYTVTCAALNYTRANVSAVARTVFLFEEIAASEPFIVTLPASLPVFVEAATTAAAEYSVALSSALRAQLATAGSYTVTVSVEAILAGRVAVSPASFLFNAANSTLIQLVRVTGIDNKIDDGDVAGAVLFTLGSTTVRRPVQFKNNDVAGFLATVMPALYSPATGERLSTPAAAAAAAAARCVVSEAGHQITWINLTMNAASVGDSPVTVAVTSSPAEYGVVEVYPASLFRSSPGGSLLAATLNSIGLPGIAAPSPSGGLLAFSASANPWMLLKVMGLNGTQPFVRVFDVGVTVSRTGTTDPAYLRLAGSGAPVVAAACTVLEASWPRLVGIFPFPISPMLGGRNLTLSVSGSTGGPVRVSIFGQVAPSVTSPKRSLRLAALQAPASGSSSAELVFTTPPGNMTGYAQLRVVDEDGGGYLIADDVLFITDDCPEPGQFGRGTACKACPEHATCPGGFRLWPDPGYWTPTEASSVLEACRPPEACLGGRTSSCAPGYEGTLCGECAAGFFKDRDRCVQCSGTPGLSGGLIVIEIIFAGLVVLGILFLSVPTLNNWMTVISVLQLLRTIGAAAGDKLPPWLSGIYRALALTHLDVEFVRPGCQATGSTFLAHFWGTIIQEALFRALIVVGMPVHGVWRAWIAHRNLRRGKPEWRVDDAELSAIRWQTFARMRLWRGMIIATAFGYFNIIVKCLQVLTCRHVPNVGLVLAVDTQVRCYRTYHIPSAIAGWILLALYMVVFPHLCLWFMWRKRFDLFTDPPPTFKSLFGLGPPKPEKPVVMITTMTPSGQRKSTFISERKRLKLRKEEELAKRLGTPRRASPPRTPGRTPFSPRGPAVTTVTVTVAENTASTPSTPRPVFNRTMAMTSPAKPPGAAVVTPRTPNPKKAAEEERAVAKRMNLGICFGYLYERFRARAFFMQIIAFECASLMAIANVAVGPEAPKTQFGLLLAAVIVLFFSYALLRPFVQQWKNGVASIILLGLIFAISVNYAASTASNFSKVGVSRLSTALGITYLAAVAVLGSFMAYKLLYKRDDDLDAGARRDGVSHYDDAFNAKRPAVNQVDSDDDDDDDDESSSASSLSDREGEGEVKAQQQQQQEQQQPPAGDRDGNDGEGGGAALASNLVDAEAGRFASGAIIDRILRTPMTTSKRPSSNRPEDPEDSEDGLQLARRNYPQLPTSPLTKTNLDLPEIKDVNQAPPRGAPAPTALPPLLQTRRKLDLQSPWNK